MPSLKDAQREKYNQDCALFAAQYAATARQLGLEINPVTKVTLQAQLKDIEKQWQEAEAALVALDSGDGDAATGLELRRQDQQLLERLSRLDFHKAREICDVTILHSQRRRQQPVALIMLHDIDEMEGDLYVDVLKQMLQENSPEFRQFPVEFGLKTQFTDEALLKSLAEYFDVPSDPDLPTFTKTLVHKICDSLRRNSTFLFEFRLIDDPFLHQQFPKWLMEHFWHPLVAQFRAVHDQKPLAKLVVLIVVHPSLIEDKLKSAYFCSYDQFAAERILPLPLSKWTREDILDWLYTLSLDEMSNDEIEEMAQQLFRLSQQGLPRKVKQLIMQEKSLRQAL